MALFQMNHITVWSAVRSKLDIEVLFCTDSNSKISSIKQWDTDYSGYLTLWLKLPVQYVEHGPPPILILSYVAHWLAKVASVSQDWNLSRQFYNLTNIVIGRLFYGLAQTSCCMQRQLFGLCLWLWPKRKMRMILWIKMTLQKLCCKNDVAKMT